MTARPTVVFVGGAGRSGSTMLGRLLGSSDGVAMVGELVHVWERGVIQDQLCGCGQHFRSCPFWTEVGASAYGGWAGPAVQRAALLRQRIDRQRVLPWVAAPRLATSRFRGELEEYAALLGRLLVAIAEVAGVDAIIDTSKHGSTAHVLRHVVDVELRAVLLVRHPVAVGHSWAKAVVRPEIVDGTVAMPTYSPARSAVVWAARNLEMHLLDALGVPVRVQRYEDLVADPVSQLHELATALGVPSPDVAGRTVVLTGDHTVAGHPNRMEDGTITIGPRDEWRDEVSPGARRTIRLLTTPLRHRYGYRDDRGGN